MNILCDRLSIVYVYENNDKNVIRYSSNQLSVNSTKSCIDNIVIPIHYILNLSITTGTYPDYWKLLISDLYQKPVANNYYRPISIFSVLPKTLEDLICGK